MSNIANWFKKTFSKKETKTKSPTQDNKKIPKKGKTTSKQHSNYTDDDFTPDEFLDDRSCRIEHEPIIRKEKVVNDEHKTVDIDTLKTAIKLTSASRYSKINRLNFQSQIPVMMTLEVDDIETNKQRAGLDLVLVIDVSSSMSGEKISLVRETLHFIIDELEEMDRISLVKFDDRSSILNGLIPATSANKKKLHKLIDEQIRDVGSTNIKLGLENAYKVLLSRKEVNDLTSIFFLSDGEDTCGNNKDSIIGLLEDYDKKMVHRNLDYKINSFGYGEGHDEDVLCGISNFKNGKFFYIKNNKLVDECFIECLGSLLSVFANNVRLDVKLNNNVEFIEKHGHLWKDQTDKNEGFINVGSLYPGLSKNYLADVKILSIPENTQHFEVMTANLLYYINDNQYNIITTLTIEIIDDDNLGEPNKIIEQNIARIEAAKLLTYVEEQNKAGNIVEAQTKVKEFKAQIQNNSYLDNDYKNKIDRIVNEDNVRDMKYVKQVYEIMSEEDYRPGFENIVQMKGKTAKMMQKKRG